MPGGFAEVLLEHGCLPRILQMVELQLVRQTFQEEYVGTGDACFVPVGSCTHPTTRLFVNLSRTGVRPFLLSLGCLASRITEFFLP